MRNGDKQDAGVTHTTQGLTRRAALQKGALGLGALALAPLIDACGGTSSSPSGATTTAASIRRGGTLTVGGIGNGSSETLNPTLFVASSDYSRGQCLFDPFLRVQEDYTFKGVLAESWESDPTASEWTLHVRKGVHFHDGSPLTADDFLYTLWAYGAPTSTTPLASSFIDLPKMRKLDNWTVRLPLKSPNSEFPAFLQLMYVIKNGEKQFSHPIGTGPFKFVSFTAGQQSTMVRNPHYWQEGKPYVDEVRVLSIQDSTARLNALLGGQIDAMESLDYAQAKQYEQSGSVKLLRQNGSNYVPIYMATTLAPFTDVRVRQAMRLIANRPQLVEQAQSGFGAVGNDLYGQGHPFYDGSLSQREQDLAQAQSLLKAAGKSDLNVTLYSSTAAAGMLESATVFASQAAQAGVKVAVKNVPAGDYFGADYLKQNFAQSLWFAYDTVLSQMARSLAPNAPYNETHWKNARWTKLYLEALATVSQSKKADIVNELQSILWNEGGYIYWGTFPVIDGLSSRLMGVTPNPGGNLGSGDYQSWWLAS